MPCLHRGHPGLRRRGLTAPSVGSYIDPMNRGIAYTEEVTVTAQCGDCGGTGLYKGFAQQEGYPTVCHSCKGSGGKTIRYKPFTGRRLKDGVRGVRPDSPAFSSRSPSDRETITYDEFRRRYPEAQVTR